jgi:hypothetical protein
VFVHIVKYHLTLLRVMLYAWTLIYTLMLQRVQRLNGIGWELQSWALGNRQILLDLFIINM